MRRNDFEYDADFSRLKETLNHGLADRVPLFDFVFDGKFKEKFLGRPVEGLDDEIEFFLRNRYDYMILHALPQYTFDSKSADGNDDGRIWLDEHHGPIRNQRDFDNYPWPDPDKIDYSVFARAEELLPDKMKVITVSGQFYAVAVALLGFENFAYLLYDNMSLVEQVFDKTSEIAYATLSKIVQFPAVGAIVTGGDIAYGTGTMVSPDFLRKHVFPRYKRITELCHAKDIPVIHHSDGNLWEVMDDLIESGINGFHPFEPEAMDIRQVKKRYGQKICIMGNVDVDHLSRSTPEKIDMEVKGLIEDIGGNGSYCLASSNSIPDYVDVENYRAMIAAALKYGKY